MKNIFEKIINLSDDRIDEFEEDIKKVDSKHKGFYKWHETYHQWMIEEVEEAFDEIKEKNSIYLEDELWDVFWDYCCLLQSLQKEWYIENVENVFKRSYKKFSERIDYVRKNDYPSSWKEIKDIQKIEREKEHKEKYWK